jgi:hypothetical protein
MTTVSPGPSMYSFSSWRSFCFSSIICSSACSVCTVSRSRRRAARRAFDVDQAIVGQIGERRRRQPHRTRSQGVEEQLFFVDSLEHRFARPMERKSRKLLVEVVRRLAQLVGAERLADVDDFLNHVPAAGDDDDENASRSDGTNSTRSNTAASCAGGSRNPTLRDDCESTCETCGRTESSRRSGCRGGAGLDGVAARVGRLARAGDPRRSDTAIGRDASAEVCGCWT